MDGLLTLVACGLRNREEVMAYFDRLFDVFEPEPPMIWNGLASACASLWPEEVIDKIRKGPNLGGKKDAQVTLLRDLCDTMVNGSLCAMGGMTPFPVQSALKHFREDFRARTRQ